MARRLIKQFLPAVTRLDRRSAARGVAIGLAWAWMPVLAPSAYASACAWKLRGSVPLAFACCWVRNPLTALPMIYAAYRVGMAITFSRMPEDASFASMGWSAFWHALLGGLVLAAASAPVGFAGVHALWRANVSWRWRRRAVRRMMLMDT